MVQNSLPLDLSLVNLLFHRLPNVDWNKANWEVLTKIAEYVFLLLFHGLGEDAPSLVLRYSADGPVEVAGKAASEIVSSNRIDPPA